MKRLFSTADSAQLAKKLRFDGQTSPTTTLAIANDHVLAIAEWCDATSLITLGLTCKQFHAQTDRYQGTDRYSLYLAGFQRTWTADPALTAFYCTLPNNEMFTRYHPNSLAAPLRRFERYMQLTGKAPPTVGDLNLLVNYFAKWSLRKPNDSDICYCCLDFHVIVIGRSRNFCDVCDLECTGDRLYGPCTICGIWERLGCCSKFLTADLRTRCASNCTNYLSINLSS